MVGVFRRGSRFGQTLKLETTCAKAWGIIAQHMAALRHVAFLLPRHRLYTQPPPPAGLTSVCSAASFATVRSIMWPDEESLEDALSDPSGNSHFSGGWAGGEHESREDMSQEIVPSRSEDDAVKNEGDGDASEGGLGAGGGLREEWEMMTPDEKVCKL